jgi:surfeit locus 1 family protein
VLSGRRALVLVAALLAAAGMARLGWWQLDRAAQKIGLQQLQQSRRALPPLAEAELARDPAGAQAQAQRLVVLQGRWLPERTVYLENRQHLGQPGFYAVTPLLLGDGSVLLVQRGWLPRDLMDRTRIVAAPPPAGTVRIEGRIAPALARLYEFAGAASGAIRQNLDLDAYAHETGLPLRPLALVQEDGVAPPADGLIRQWPQPAADVQKHYGYAFQWFALSALVLGLYVWFQLVRPARARRPSPAA